VLRATAGDISQIILVAFRLQRPETVQSFRGLLDRLSQRLRLLLATTKQDVERRQDKQRQQRRSDQPADCELVPCFTPKPINTLESRAPCRLGFSRPAAYRAMVKLHMKNRTA
jgi:hypothetical protein